MQLKEHLIATLRPQAKLSNIVFWRDYRVTVLGTRLFRVEKNGKKRFRDGATQSVWFRDVKKQPFTVEYSPERALIKTPDCTLLLKPKRKDCKVLLDGAEVPIDNKANLGGTYRTLDCCDGDIFYDYANGKKKKIRLGDGVCAKNGVAYFADERSLTLGENGEIENERGEGLDHYVFAFGKDYRGAVRALYSITGASPMLPRYAFGNWWSRYYPYSDKEYLRLLQRFEDREIPLTVAVVDIDWHYTATLDEKMGITEKGRNTEFYGGNSGWTGYTWNTDLFPDYRAFLKKIEQRNLKLSLNLHPADGIRWWEDGYEQMANATGIDPQTSERVAFDMTSVEFINSYFSVLHNPYEEDGVAFWWIDWQQGTKSKMDGLDPLWSLNHYHYYDIARTGKKPLILSRYGGVGSHRYPVGFSGDTLITWKTLAYLPYFTATASNIGYSWWSHDIGAHMLGETTFELYARHLQYGVFSPVNRLHSSDMVTMTKEPWCYGNGAGLVAADFLKLRHSLIPFLYSCAYRTEKDGRALVEPLYYEWAEEEKAYEYKTQYLFGGLLVAPVTTPIQKDGYAHTKVWIPEGKWTDIFTGDTYEAGKEGEEKTLLRRLESLPVLAKAGTILPLSADKGNAVENPSRLRVLAFEGNGEFILYEDGKESGKAGEYVTRFTAELKEKDGEKLQTLRIAGKGSKAVLPKNRTLTLEFVNVPNGEIVVYENGKRVQAKERVADCAAVTVAFTGGETIVELRYKELSRVDALIKRAQDVLCRSEGDNTDKFWHCYEHLKKAKTVEEYVLAVRSAPIREAAKLRLLETI
ncbi:MAG: alpha-xylosidase [Clostridia bacterium]|nr:alpha-xylosidase [Clostridia bacterium]